MYNTYMIVRQSHVCHLFHLQLSVNVKGELVVVDIYGLVHMDSDARVFVGLCMFQSVYCFYHCYC